MSIDLTPRENHGLRCARVVVRSLYDAAARCIWIRRLVNIVWPIGQRNIHSGISWWGMWIVHHCVMVGGCMGWCLLRYGRTYCTLGGMLGSFYWVIREIWLWDLTLLCWVLVRVGMSGIPWSLERMNNSGGIM